MMLGTTNIKFIYSECVSVALVIQHTKRMRRILLRWVACLVVPYFSTVPHKRQDFREKIWKVYFDFHYSFFRNIYHSKKKPSRYYRYFTYVFMLSVRHSCQILVKVEFFQHIFENYSNIKFHENPSSGRHTVSCRRADRHDEAHTRFSQLCERA